MNQPNLKFVPTFSEVWERCRFSIPQFARDFLDVDPFPHQVAWFNNGVWAVERVFVAGNRAGKASLNTEPVLTPNGWKPIGEIAVGDEVYSQDGQPTLVNGVFPQGRVHLYRMEFDDGSSTIVSDDHLWTVRTARERFRKDYGEGVPNPQYRQWTVLDTKTILERWGANPKPKQRVSIPMVQPIEFPEKEIPLDPYALGLLLGNGSMSQKGVGYSTSDDETLDDIPFNSAKRGNKYDWGISGAVPVLRSLGLMGKHSWDKFVPKQYLWSGSWTRFSVLQGLMDTDGYADPHKSTLEYCTTSEQLAKDLMFIVQSLGGKGRVTTKIPTFTHKGEKRTGKLAYRIFFNLPEFYPPFRLERKLKRWKHRATTDERILVKIEDAGYGDATCISVENPSCLYVTRDFIVTHNTYSSAIKHLHHILFQTRQPKYATMTSRYVSVNVALSLDMAQIAYQIAVQKAEDSALYRQFILTDECKSFPFPVFVVGDGKRGKKGFRSELWARSTANGAKFLLGKDVDRFSFDECAFQPDGRQVVEKVLLMRLADRSGAIDYVSSPNGRNWYYDLFQETQKPSDMMNPPGYYYGQTASSYENGAIDHERLRINERRFSEAERLQNVLGVFADQNGVFSGTSIERCYRDQDYSLPISPVRGGIYVKAWDFAALRDETVGLVARIDVKPAQIVYVGHWGGDGSGIGFVGDGGIYEQVARIHALYPGPTYGDSTGPAGKLILETITKSYDVAMKESDISGSRGRAKENLIAAGRQALDARSIVFPYVESTQKLVNQLRYYQLKDENIATDYVMAFCILAEAMRKEGFVEDLPPEESSAPWGTNTTGPVLEGENCDCEFNSEMTWCRKHHMPLNRGEACCGGEPHRFSIPVASTIQSALNSLL